MRIKRGKDFYSGLLFILVGGGFAWGSTAYQVGSAAQMGPGYFPLMLGVLLALVGFATAFQSLGSGAEDEAPVAQFAWKPLCFIVLANLAFGVLVGGLPRWGIPHLGLICAIVVATFISSMASDRFRVKGVLILSLVLSASCYLIFAWMLKLRIPVWPAFWS
jgi:Tripartite tricarboxylate transporter TctB family